MNRTVGLGLSVHPDNWGQGFPYKLPWNVGKWVEVWVELTAGERMSEESGYYLTKVAERESTTPSKLAAIDPKRTLV